MLYEKMSDRELVLEYARVASFKERDCEERCGNILAEVDRREDRRRELESQLEAVRAVAPSAMALPTMNIPSPSLTADYGVPRLGDSAEIDNGLPSKMKDQGTG